MQAEVIYPVDTKYLDVWELQEKYFNELRNNSSSENMNAGYIIFCEHPHVYTIGKSGSMNNLLVDDDFLKKIDASLFRINRGGDITYHGPGQIVCYPVLNLKVLKIGIRSYIESLEEIVIQTLKKYDVKAGRKPGATGVWCDAESPDERKIAAIGVRASNYITMHGFALNVITDLSYFNHINPCGFSHNSVTSIQKETGVRVDIAEVENSIAQGFHKILGLSLKYTASR